MMRAYKKRLFVSLDPYSKVNVRTLRGPVQSVIPGMQGRVLAVLAKSTAYLDLVAYFASAQHQRGGDPGFQPVGAPR